jgi:hypothetical protein
MKAIGIILTALIFVLLWLLPLILIQDIIVYLPKERENMVSVSLGVWFATLFYVTIFVCSVFYNWFKSNIKTK